MTDERIIKALDIHIQNQYCDGCPYDKNAFCEQVLIHDAGDLINRQKAEIKALINGQETLQKYIAEQKAEIERLLTENHSLAIVQEGFKDMYKISQVEAIKEFAERLKEKLGNGG